MFKIGVVGSRSITDAQKVFEYLNQYQYEDVMIITGGAIGVDSFAEFWARSNKKSHTVFYPNYKKYGKVAPLKRNDLIVGESQKLIAFWDGKSRGTMDSVTKAQDKGITVDLVKF